MAFLRPFQRTCQDEECHDLATQELWHRNRSHGLFCDPHARSALEVLKAKEKKLGAYA